MHVTLRPCLHLVLRCFGRFNHKWTTLNTGVNRIQNVFSMLATYSTAWNVTFSLFASNTPFIYFRASSKVSIYSMFFYAWSTVANHSHVNWAHGQSDTFQSEFTQAQVLHVYESFHNNQQIKFWDWQSYLNVELSLIDSWWPWCKNRYPQLVCKCRLIDLFLLHVIRFHLLLFSFITKFAINHFKALLKQMWWKNMWRLHANVLMKILM